MAQRGYVKSIAGLRAIAVLSIVAYHIDAGWMPGGFVGVDIFFVISGFVVAHSVSTTPHDTFRQYVGWFYKRRFQRILPAAYLYIAAALAAGLLFIPLTGSTKFFEVTGAAAAVGLSNIVLWIKTGDYFALSSEMNPFTHTWSLAVEEQYYLIFPFLSYPIWAARDRHPVLRRSAVAAVVLGCVASLLASVALSRHAPTFAFYMLPARLWELGSGFLLRLALTPARSERLRRRTVAIADVLALAALAGVAFACLHTDPRAFPFPGALLPCGATLVLIALFWCHPGIRADRLLSMRGPVWVGDISYSLYLWHWGVIVLMRWTVGIDTLALRLLAAVLMLVLAWLSHRHVETRFHNAGQRRRPPSARFFGGWAVTAGVLIALCAGTYLAKPRFGLPAADRLALWDPYRRPPMPAACAAGKQSVPLGAGSVTTFPTPCGRPGTPRLFMLGDSHAGAYQRALWRIAASGAYEPHLLSLGGCRIVVIAQVPAIPGCDDFLKRAMARIALSVRPGDVIVLPGLQTTRYRVGDSDIPLAVRPLSAPAIAASRARLAALARRGAPIIVEGAKPVMPYPLFRCADWFNRANPVCRAPAGYSPAEARSRMAAADRGVAAAALGIPHVTIWRPGPLLCPGGACPATIDGRPLYFDTDHLSAFGNDLLLPSLLDSLAAARGLSARSTGAPPA